MVVEVPASAPSRVVPAAAAMAEPKTRPTDDPVDAFLAPGHPGLVVLNGCSTGQRLRAGGGGFPAAYQGVQLPPLESYMDEIEAGRIVRDQARGVYG